jgi:hypothetical protein
MFRKKIAQDLGGYRAAFEAAEDYDLWLRMSEVTQIANLADELVQYRWHNANVSARRAIRQAFSVRLAQRSADMRRRTGQDPAADLVAPPDWRLPQSLDTFFAEDAAAYRLLDLADPNSVPGSAEIDFSPLVARISELNHAERKLAVRAMANYLRHASPSNRYRICGFFVQMVRRRPGMALLAVRHFVRPVP